MKADRNLLKNYIRMLVESRIRETDITDGSRVPFGSKKHVADLEFRIADLERWRDRQRRGSEARANYARLIGRLRSELRAASRYSERVAAEVAGKFDDPKDDDLLIDEATKKVIHWESVRGTGPACGGNGKITAHPDDISCAKCKAIRVRVRRQEEN